jgi:hypothetical protein
VLSFKFKYVMINGYITWVPCTINWHNKGQFSINYTSPITGLEYFNYLVSDDIVEWDFN